MATKRRLIYADEARAAVLRENPAIAYCIDRVKTAEAAPIVHTSWEKEPIGYGFYRERCKACGEWSLGMDKPYCPMCGAKADGGNYDG